MSSYCLRDYKRKYNPCKVFDFFGGLCKYRKTAGVLQQDQNQEQDRGQPDHTWIDLHHKPTDRW